MVEDLLQSRSRQYRNRSLYSVLDQAAGLPYQTMPEPVMTGQSSPGEKNKNKMLWILGLGAVAFLLFGKAFKKELKKL